MSATFLDRAACHLSGAGGARRRARPAGRAVGAADLRRPGRPGPGPGGRSRPARHRPGRTGGRRVAQLVPAADLVLRGVRMGQDPGARSTSAWPGPRSRTSSSTPAPRCCWSTPSSTRRWPASVRRGASCSAPKRRRALRRPGPSPCHGSRTRRPPPPSTTPRAPPPGPRASSSPTATAGSTPSLFGWHVGVSDRDVYLHTLPMFHANGWGMPWATAAMGAHPGGPAQGGRPRDPPPGRPARGDPPVRGPGRGERRTGRGRRSGTARCPGPAPPGSWWPARRRRRGPSSGSSPSWAGSSSRSTA